MLYRHNKATQLRVANTRSAEPNHASPPRVGVVLVEQGRAFDNSIAALDVNGRQQALLRRPDLNEIRFGIALPFNHHRVARAQEEPRADNKAKDRDDGNDNTRLCDFDRFYRHEKVVRRRGRQEQDRKLLKREIWRLASGRFFQGQVNREEPPRFAEAASFR